MKKINSIIIMTTCLLSYSNSLSPFYKTHNNSENVKQLNISESEDSDNLFIKNDFIGLNDEEYHKKTTNFQNAIKALSTTAIIAVGLLGIYSNK